MKTFDLTFSGKVLPEYDPAHVCQGLAGLFHIHDPHTAEALLGGETIYLCCDLDRRTAAEYFREIALFGGEAALVDSDKRELNGNGGYPRLLWQKGQPAQLVYSARDLPGSLPDCIDQRWPVAARPAISVAEFPGPAAESPEAVPPNAQAGPGSAVLATHRAGRQPAARLLRLIDRIRNKHMEEADRLQRRIETYRRIAQEEIASLHEQQSRVAERTERSMDRITSIALESRARGAARISGIRRQQDRQRRDFAAGISALEREAQQRTEARDTALAELAVENRRASRRTAATIALLRQQIKALQEEAAAEGQRYRERVSALEAEGRCESGEIGLQKTAARAGLEKTLAKLTDRRESMEHCTAAELARLKQHRRTTRRVEEAGIEQLRGIEADIRRRRDQGIQQARDAQRRLRRHTAGQLRRLRAIMRRVGSGPVPRRMRREKDERRSNRGA